MFVVKLVLSVLLIGVLTAMEQYFINDGCRQRELKEEGKCVLIFNCPYAIKLVHQSKHPQVCGFSGIDPIVCCPLDNIIANTTVAAEENPTGNSISNQKCKEYQGKRANKRNRFSILVAGGIKASAKEFPHMAVLGYEDVDTIVWLCGGSLISEQYVLTAAHCISSQQFGIVKFVRLGDLNLKLETDGVEPQTFNVASTIVHPEYKPSIHYHDIALIKLEKRAKFTIYVRPACLYTNRTLPDNLQPIATGWGKLGFLGDSSEDLMKVTLSYYTNDRCRQIYSNVGQGRLPNGIVDDTQICAGGINESKDTCQGDSGGPLQLRTPEETTLFHIIGITSFGKGCGVTNIPGVYTRVSNYLSWIESIVWS